MSYTPEQLKQLNKAQSVKVYDERWHAQFIAAIQMGILPHGMWTSGALARAMAIVKGGHQVTKVETNRGLTHTKINVFSSGLTQAPLAQHNNTVKVGGEMRLTIKATDHLLSVAAVDGWEEVEQAFGYHLVVTSQNVVKGQLKQMRNKFMKAFGRLLDNLRRGRVAGVTGYVGGFGRSEITLNDEALSSKVAFNLYHDHRHTFIAFDHELSEEEQEALINAWLTTATSFGLTVTRAAQMIKPMGNTAEDFNELTKYIVKPDKLFQLDPNERWDMEVWAEIYEANYGFHNTQFYGAYNDVHELFTGKNKKLVNHFQAPEMAFGAVKTMTADMTWNGMQYVMGETRQMDEFETVYANLPMLQNSVANESVIHSHFAVIRNDIKDEYAEVLADDELSDDDQLKAKVRYYERVAKVTKFERWAHILHREFGGYNTVLEMVHGMQNKIAEHNRVGSRLLAVIQRVGQVDAETAVNMAWHNNAPEVLTDVVSQYRDNMNTANDIDQLLGAMEYVMDDEHQHEWLQYQRDRHDQSLAERREFLMNAQLGTNDPIMADVYEKMIEAIDKNGSINFQPRSLRSDLVFLPGYYDETAY